MASEGELTRHIPALREGDNDAFAAVWEAFFERLVRLAQRKLSALRTRAVDGEDIAISAMNSFYRGLKAGRFDKLDDRTDLWKVLVTITKRKASAEHRYQKAQKRDVHRLRGESVFIRVDSEHDGPRGIEQIADDEPSPRFVEELVRTCNEMLDVLGDDLLKQIALRTLEGYTTTEIADEIGRARRTVERKLSLIRRIWTEHGYAPPELDTPRQSIDPTMEEPSP